MAKKYTTPFLISIIILTLFFLNTQHAFASVGQGGSLPYEDWLDKLKDSLTGPVAFAVSIIGMVVAGATLIFGGELNAFFRSLIFLVLVMALLIGAQNIMGRFFGHGAVIASIDAKSTSVKSQSIEYVTV
ncbi:TrbC/VirB2 family protein [Bartonella sp. DGB2]|uniref:TrbC/VirB2 family protein n=1 Tax=Bartonella sp. DGB2 TaxID=3388426 RepID=UPI0039903543